MRNRTAMKITLSAVALSLSLSTAQARDIDDEIWCPDITEDGKIDFDDVRRLTLAEGPCPGGVADPEVCPEDVNHNGFVGRLDLVSLLGHWGPCRCKGDLNGDGFRTQDDITLIQQAIAEGLECGVDIDHSGEVRPMDYEIEIVSWTSDPDSDPRSDVNGSGTLTALDVLEVFTALSESRDCRAEVTGDGLVNQDDIEFVTRLVELAPPCP
ncbi:MAG: hypothetical protein K0U98_20555 [Deltaproteobacteria bacterium]|nr:hypothetical protein [Deltaproteobacteria bacterium]